MDLNILSILIYFGTVIGSNEFNNYLERLNFKEFNELFKNEEFSADEAYYLANEMSYFKLINLLIGLNIIYSLLNYKFRKKKMDNLIFRVKKRLTIIEAMRKSNAELEIYYNAPRKYFVGYFEGEKPVVIWFTFNGVKIDISEDSSPTFNILSDYEKEYIFVSILNDLINGVEGYMYSDNINEILNTHLVRNILSEFQMEHNDFNRSR